MFYVQVDGKQYPLGITDEKDIAGAAEAHATLLAQLAQQVANVQTPPAQQSTITVAAAVAAYLSKAERKVALGKIGSRSVRNYKIALKAFVAAFGTRQLASLTAEELEAWAAKPSWSASYQNTTLGTIGSLLRANKVTLDQPLQRPSKESRGASVCLTDAQFQTVLENVYTKHGKPGDLIPLLKLLRECGARPGEATALTVESIDWKNCCTMLTEHKTKKKTGKNRLLVFNSAAMDVLRGQKERYGTGLLFRTRGGCKAYGPNVIVKQLLKVSKRVGFRVLAYSLRHQFCSRALAAGVPDAVVAALMGHQSTTMIHKHYAHINEHSRALKEAAEKVSSYRDAG